MAKINTSFLRDLLILLRKEEITFSRMAEMLNKKAGEGESPDDGTCQSCNKNPGTDNLHTCPFKSEIHYNDSTLCNCCDNCRHECAMDI